ncbi:hypothetical protein ODJ79_19980 [Actinoplanes sp. KI2]|uniref:Rv1733c family protein n=1 Tax=Actinoplanes sp. KI2 TaxID=2983315 RepID=UPI0021D5810D|nr:hypothetical protein [Actinoplanes sp. KI2]MCU7726010.1 hypothetical protein [Actinoplanes sp. KI2]
MGIRSLLRRLGWHRNPLRRGSDRVEAWLNAVLLITLALAGSAMAVGTSRGAYRAEEKAAAWDRTHRFEVWAVLVSKPAAPQGTAQARWKAPDGSPRTGPVTAALSTAAGAWVPIWVDETGAVSTAPPHHSPATHAAGVGAVTLLLVAAALAAIWLFCRRLLDRQRLRTWQDEWLEVGPRWSKYR